MKVMAIRLFAQQIFLALFVTLRQNVLGIPFVLSQYPKTIEKNPGESATIFCKLSNETITENMILVWYKYTHEDKSKLGEINLKTKNFTVIDQIQLIWDHGNYTAKMSVQQLNVNNSGIYGCELFAFDNNVDIRKASATNITVTFAEGQTATPEPRNNTNSTSIVRDFTNMETNIHIILAAVTATFVICLLFFILVRYRPKKQDPDTSPPTVNANCQKPNDQISTVFSVDYAVLQVPEKNIRQNLTTSVASDDSYYATIVFGPQ